jgi:hypothetical protein
MEESLETRNGKRLDTGPSSNPEWLAVECHVLAFEVSLGCKIQLVKIVLVREPRRRGAAEIGSPLLVFFLSESGLLG